MTNDRDDATAGGDRRRTGSRSTPVSRRMGVVAGVLAGSGLLSLVFYAAGCAQPLSVLGAGVLVTGAVAAAGAALGFLFGVPRALAAEPSPYAPEIRPAYIANTNLEQVSDWLTKLLIGAGLTQLGSLAAWFKRFCATLAPALGDRPDSTVFAGALVAEFLVLGFLSGWLSTRLLLAPALSEADRRALDSFVQAESLSRRGAEDEADSLRALAMEELGLPHREARRYDDLRRRLPRGSGRTEQMQALVAAARDSARDSGLSPEQVGHFFRRGGDGERIYALALMQGSPETADLDTALEGIERSRSAFEQYQALVAAECMAPLLSPAELARLQRSVREQLAPGSFVARSTDRRRVAERILRTQREPGDDPDS
ncbi:hypothetical protein [Streptomyces sp. NBC_00076]|uniref:hypothetical protein n=1 Tax=Streptomyces sp. NBC_00076 TaxID=2975642 RepID=UPI003246EDC0